jgi:predicted ATPase
MPFRLQVRNYRGLRAIDWSPEGVCALVGPNGSGKTTLLDVPALLGDALDRGLARALESHGGIKARNLYAPEREPYDFTITLGDTVWRLAPFLAESGFRSEENLVVDGSMVFTREPGADNARFVDNERPVHDGLALSVSPAAESLHQALSRYRVYRGYDLERLRAVGSSDSSGRRLDQHGRNVFTVLRNWRDKKSDRGRYAFVIDGLREVFSDFFDDLEFEKAGLVVGADLRLKGDHVHAASLAPDGWFVALLHLTAIASTDDGDLIAIDEPENALHPHAIKLLLERMRAWSRRRSVTVMLATHSPVIINDFETCPEQLFVMQQDRPVNPVSVVDLKERDWLAHFALGDLYVREEFGAPKGDAEPRADHDG